MQCFAHTYQSAGMPAEDVTVPDGALILKSRGLEG